MSFIIRFNITQILVSSRKIDEAVYYAFIQLFALAVKLSNTVEEFTVEFSGDGAEHVGCVMSDLVKDVSRHSSHEHGGPATESQKKRS